jgi:hypothetical protein
MPQPQQQRQLLLLLSWLWSHLKSSRLRVGITINKACLNNSRVKHITRGEQGGLSGAAMARPPAAHV